MGILLSLRSAEHYLPLVRSLRNRLTTEPLFPGYLFCRVEIPSSQWVEIRSLPGIAYVLSAEGKPSAVGDELVEAIRTRVLQESGSAKPSRFNAGDRVRILRGPLEGIEAAFDRRLSPSGRSQVLVRLLSRLVRVDLDESHLQRVS